MTVGKSISAALLAALLATTALPLCAADNAQPAAPSKASAVTQADMDKALDMLITVRLKNAPLSALCDVMSVQTKLNFIIDPSVPSNHKVTMFLRNTRVRDVLEVLRRMGDIEVEKTSDNTYSLKRLDKEVTVTEIGRNGDETTSTLKAGKLEVPPGYRGASIDISTSKMGSIRPGDRIDVLVTFDAIMANNSKEKVTATILQNVLVLDVLRGANSEDTGAIKMALNPVEAQYNALSLYQGNVDVVRRDPGDTEMHPMEIASFKKLFK